MITAKRIMLTLAAAASVTAVTAAVFTFTAPAHKDASATVCFLGGDEEDTSFVTRNSSLLRRLVTSDVFLSELSRICGVDKEILSNSVRVERMTNSECTQIILYDLDDPTYAPIILGAAINRIQQSEAAPEINVLSYCDLENEPVLPRYRLSVCTGLAAALTAFLAVPDRKDEGKHKHKKNTQKHHADENIVQQNVVSPEELLMSRIREIGRVQPSSPEGFEKSGYAEAAKNLLEMYRHRPIVIGISAAYNDHRGEIPFETRLTAYLSCALAAQGKRVAAVECSLKKPALGRQFGKTSKYGLSDIAAGSCPVWDTLIVGARPGVDVISEPKSYPAPMAVFASARFDGIIKYLSSQYDVLLLHLPKAWECEEWNILQGCCSGIVLALQGERMPDNTTLNGIAASRDGFVTICRVVSDVENGEEKRSAEYV